MIRKPNGPPKVALTCARCGLSFTGPYITALNATWHDKCFRCAACDVPLPASAQFNLRDSKPYHPACYAAAFLPRCARCAGTIEGPYVTSPLDNAAYHAPCFACARCGKSLAGKDGRFLEKDGKVYCEEDYIALFAPKCDVCAAPMTSRYCTDFWGDKYCERHETELPKCCSCYRPMCKTLTRGGKTYPDGTKICGICNETAVADDNQLALLFSNVTRAMNTYMGLTLPPSSSKPSDVFPIRLDTLDRLTSLAPRTHRAKPPNGVTVKQTTTVTTKHSTGATTTTKRRAVQEILVLRGLPEKHAAAVLAHEFGHAWLFLNGFTQLPPVVEEGFCEYCSMRWLETPINNRSAENRFRMDSIANNKDPVYGDGYRVCAAAVKKHSLPKVLDYIRKHQAFPL